MHDNNFRPQIDAALQACYITGEFIVRGFPESTDRLGHRNPGTGIQTAANGTLVRPAIDPTNPR